MFLSDLHTCERRTCRWSNYDKNTDWGYYSKTNGDCTVCKDRCGNDTKCGAVECGGKYCTWWKIGKCISENERNPSRTYYTCQKRQY